MAAVPVVNSAVTVATRADGGLRLSYPITVKPLLAGIARRTGLWDGGPMRRELDLDETGSLVFGWIDGRTNVAELSAKLREAYSLHAREAEMSTTAFLRELGRRGIVGFAEGRGKAG